MAALSNHTDMLQLLLDSGANVNEIDECVITCCCQRCPRLPRGCLVTVLLRDGSAALHFAAMSDSAEIAALLLDRGANVNAKAS